MLLLYFRQRVATANNLYVRSQMIEIFDPCVNRTLELIDGQVASVLKSGKPKPKVN